MKTQDAPQIFRQPSRRGLLWRYRAFFAAGTSMILIGLASRFYILNLGLGKARPAAEHCVGGAGLMIVLFGLFIACDYDSTWRKKKTRDTVSYCRKTAWAAAGSLIVIHFGWEWGQGYSSHIASHYDANPRGYIQWEQVSADWLGLLAGLTVVHGFISSMPRPAQITPETDTLV